jgi:hypothetical protein
MRAAVVASIGDDTERAIAAVKQPASSVAYRHCWLGLEWLQQLFSIPFWTLKVEDLPKRYENSSAQKE